MFEIKCIVADKKVVEVIDLLDGHTLEPPVVLRVRGAMAANGHDTTSKKADTKSSWMTAPGGSINIMRAYVKNHETVTVKQLRSHLVGHGYSSNGYSYALQYLVKEGTLKKTKKPATYEVVHG